jgi:hypothetical protein
VPADEVTSALGAGGEAFDPTQVARCRRHRERRRPAVPTPTVASTAALPRTVDDDALAQQAADLSTELQTGVNPADVPPATDPTPETPSTTQEGA